VIKTCIRGFAMDKQNRWDEHLEEFLAAIRSSVHETTKYSPYSLMFGQEMCLNGEYPPKSEAKESEEVVEPSPTDNRVIAEAQKNIKNAQRRWKANYDKKTSNIKYKVGQWVMRKNFKLSNKVEGYSAKQGPKYLLGKIVEDKGSGVYGICDKNGKIGVYHSDVLKPASNIMTRSRKKEMNDAAEISDVQSKT
jgi:hypothetical protein